MSDQSRLSKELQDFLGAFTLAFKAKFGDRAALVLAAGAPEDGAHDCFQTSWVGPCLTAKGLIHHAIPELDRSIQFTTKTEAAWPTGGKP